MVTPADVSAVLVTRGDVDMRPIIDSLCPPFPEVLVWNNSGGDDLAVYGRYAMIERAKSSVVYVQDDDCILPVESIEALIAAYRPGHVVCNMPERFREHYPDSGLVGFGAVFDRDLPEQAFARFSEHSFDPFPEELGRWRDSQPFFYRTCDVVFTTLTPRILVDVPMQILDYAHGEDRMWKQPGHVAGRQRMLALARQVRDAVPA